MSLLAGRDEGMNAKFKIENSKFCSRSVFGGEILNFELYTSAFLTPSTPLPQYPPRNPTLHAPQPPRDHGPQP
jgi:hypothetical protein